MILLTNSVSDLEVVTSAAETISVLVSYSDLSTTTFAPASAQFSITTATTTTVVSAPASNARQVKYVSIYNKGAGSNTITVQLNGGYQLFKMALPIDYSIHYSSETGWVVYDNTGKIQTAGGGGGGGASAFTDLTDVPGSYTGSATYMVAVNATEDGLEFVDIQTELNGKQDLDQSLTDIAALVDPNADRFLFWDDSAGAIAYLTPSTGVTITGTNLTASGTPAGLSTYVQYNSGGSFGGDSGFTYTGSGNATLSGSLTIAGGAAYYAGGSQVLVADGGTGRASATAYAPIYGGTTSTGAHQSGTVGTSGQLLQSSGAGVIPAWTTATYPSTASTAGKRLKSDGTNLIMSTTTMPDSGTNRKMIVGNGTNYVESTETWAVPGTSGNVLTSDGTNWTSAAPSGGSGGMSWSTASGTTLSAAVNNGYVTTNASQCVVTLPGTAAVGSIVALAGQGAGGWQLKGNTGQTIKGVGDTTSSAGTITPANRYDTIEVVCIVANTDWTITSFTSTMLTFA